jgi:hypothetical protein
VASVCAGKQNFCKVLFWTDPAGVPFAMPMDSAAARLIRAEWTQNSKTHHRKMRWACDIEPNPAVCFKP